MKGRGKDGMYACNGATNTKVRAWTGMDRRHSYDHSSHSTSRHTTTNTKNKSVNELALTCIACLSLENGRHGLHLSDILKASTSFTPPQHSSCPSSSRPVHPPSSDGQSGGSSSLPCPIRSRRGWVARARRLAVCGQVSHCPVKSHISDTM